MYAVIETGGKQYKVAEGDAIYVEKLDAPVGEQVVLDRVLLVSKDGDVVVGTPTVADAKVTAKVEDHGKGEKIIVLKYKPKKNYRKKTGHRQPFTVIEKLQCNRLLAEDVGLRAPTMPTQKILSAQRCQPSPDMVIGPRSAGRQRTLRLKTDFYNTLPQELPER